MASIGGVRHAHHSLARQWLTTLNHDGAAFCRITQMGFLRLLTSKKVMGVDVLSPMKAWEIYSEIQKNPRITFWNEPSALESQWRSLTPKRTQAHYTWTNAYLIAFAQARELKRVSLGQSMASPADTSTLVLSN